MNDKKYLYESMPVSRAVISLALPTVLSQLITVIYNMADTFFIGQLGDPAQVAAATICMPPFILLSGIANLFGIGGSSLIARSLGEGNREKAKKTAVFCIFSSVFVGIIYGLLFLFLKPYLLPFLGTGPSTYDHCFSYLFYTVTLGAAPTVLSGCLSHLVRAEGYSKEASFGIALGGILNIALDPLFIFAFDMDITGAAVATAISNLISALYFITIVLKRKNTSVISAKPSLYSLKGNIPGEVISVGLPNFIMNIMAIASNTVLNNLMASYSDAAIAGIGIAKKIDMLTLAVSLGMSQGVISLIAYNFSSKNYKRMLSAIKTTFIYIGVVSIVTTLFLFFCAAPVSRFFIDDTKTIEYGQYFLKVLCIICPMQAFSMMVVTIMQAIGKKAPPLVLSFLRKGLLDTPFMFLLNSLVGVWGIAWATPIAEGIAVFISLFFLIPSIKYIRGLQKK